MNRKTRSLSAEDGRTLDLILDHGAGHGEPRGPALTRMAAGVSHRRLIAAARLLATLDALPAVAPPADLVARTLSRIAADRPSVVQPTVSVPTVMH